MADLSKILARYRNDLISTARIASAGVSHLTQSGTPVDQGDLRDDWTPAINGIGGVNRGGDPSAVVNQLQVGDTYSYSNNMPYARRIEYEGHSAEQAPDGMMGPALAQWQQQVDQAAAKVRRGN